MKYNWNDIEEGVFSRLDVDGWQGIRIICARGRKYKDGTYNYVAHLLIPSGIRNIITLFKMRGICLDDAKIKAEEFLDNIESSLNSFKK